MLLAVAHKSSYRTNLLAAANRQRWNHGSTKLGFLSRLCGLRLRSPRGFRRSLPPLSPLQERPVWIYSFSPRTSSSWRGPDGVSRAWASTAPSWLPGCAYGPLVLPSFLWPLVLFFGGWLFSS